MPKDTAAPCPTSLEGTLPYVAQVGHHLLEQFAIDSVGGAAGRSSGEHAQGLALDLMGGTTTGNQLAEYVLANQSEFGVKYSDGRVRRLRSATALARRR